MKKLNKTMILFIIILVSLIIVQPKVYAASRIRGYNALINSKNTANVVVLADWDELRDSRIQGKLNNLFSVNYNKDTQFNNLVVNMGDEYHHTYCVQHKVGNVVSDMRVKHYIKIQGSKMVDHDWATTQGKDKNGNDIWVAKRGATYDGKENAILAYILTHNTNTKNCSWSSWRKSAVQTDSNHGNAVMDGPRQLALKKYWNTWVRAVASKKVLPTGGWIGNNSFSDTNATNAVNDAEKYYSIGEKAYIGSTTTKPTDSNSALKIDYVGTITSIEAEDWSNKKIDSSYIEFYTDSAYKNKIKNISNIPNNKTSFYVKCTSPNQSIKTLRINVKNETYQVELWFLESTGYLGSENIVSAGQTSACQKLITVKDRVLNTTNYVDIAFAEEPKGSFTINKTDAVTSTVINNSEASFKVKTSSGWLSGSKGSYIYNNTEAMANTYSTTKGILTIDGLKYGTYTVKEITSPVNYMISNTTLDVTIDNAHQKPSKNYSNTPLGNITITKKDSKTKNTILEITQFKVYKKDKGWLTDINKYHSDESKAKLYQTSNGKLELKGLLYGDYTIKEVSSPNGYILAVQPTKSINVTLANSNRYPNVDYTNLKKGSITINKKDVDTNQNIEGAGFKIQTSNGWLQGKQAPYTYNTSYENATIYRFKNEYSLTDNIIYSSGNGLKIDGLDDGAYHIYEVEPPTGYLLKHQEGYDASKGYVDTNKVITISSNSQVYDIETIITNVKKISIEGYVWEDTQAIKDGEFNSLYDSSRESKIKGVNVKLIDKTTGEAVGTTTTDDKGKYLFDNLIKLSKLENYYVEFDYNGVMGKRYIPVKFISGTENASKALMKNVAVKDVDLSGKATTYTGTSAISTYGLMKCGSFDEPNLTLGNINLGIKKIPDVDYYIDENLEYVDIFMKGYKYRYKYGSGGDSSSVAAPKVNFQKKGTISGYTADIYPSDIAYEVKNGKEELKVYVGYRIDITNTTTLGIGDAAKNYEELYQEKTLHISKLTDTFDTNRYQLDDSNWDVQGNVATIKENYLNDIRQDGIESEKTATKRIQFKVNRNAIIDILNHPYGIIEENPTKAIATGYHKYTRYDYGWDYNIKTNEQQTHITPDDTREADAPYLIFKLGQERILSGKVFEDKVVTTDGQKLGNGVYDNNENVVEGVKVELLDVNGTETDITKLTLSNIYGVQGEGDTRRTYISKPAQAVTDKDGKYTLNGIVPGFYYLRFTYGDGTQKIYDIKGNLISTIKGKKYKSTIVTNNIAKNALNGGTDVEWYKKINNSDTSVAIDNLTTRKLLSEGTNIMAGTAKMSITIENDSEDSNDVAQKDNGKIQNVKDLTSQVENKFEGLTFGIIEVPKQESEIEKVITNVKLTNTSGQILYNGNPENIPSQGGVALSDLDGMKNGGSTYVRAEITEESLYGTNLELTYEVKITNKSDINYYNKEYYWYGEKNVNKEVTLTPTVVKDYLDQTLTYDEEKSDKDRIKEINKNQTIQVDGKSIKAQEYNLEGWKAIYTNKITNRDSSHPTTDKVIMVAKRLLSNQDDDMVVISRAEIKEIKPTPDLKDTDATEQKTDSTYRS